jgi:hypothetical protein
VVGQGWVVGVEMRDEYEDCKGQEGEVVFVNVGVGKENQVEEEEHKTSVSDGDNPDERYEVEVVDRNFYVVVGEDLGEVGKAYLDRRLVGDKGRHESQ